MVSSSPANACHVLKSHILSNPSLFSFLILVIKVGLNEFASLLSDGSQKAQIEHYMAEV